MAHQLNFSRGKTSMMYVNEVPWHGLGQKLDNLATAKECIEAAQLDFKVEKWPVLGKSKGGIMTKVSDTHFATVRTDTNQILGTVGTGYQPVQNVDGFSFFDALIGDGEAVYETAGALGLGERVWMLAKLPDYIRIGKSDDIINKYLLLLMSHDGKSSIVAKLTPVRVVCNNTLSLALTDGEQQVRVRHSRNAKQKLEQAHKLLQLTNKVYDQVSAAFEKMSLIKVSESQLMRYINALVPDNADSENHTRTEKARAEIFELAHVGQGAELETAKGTLWGGYNAAVEYADHVRSYRGGDNGRLNSLWFGSGERFKQGAFDLAMKAVEAGGITSNILKGQNN